MIDLTTTPTSTSTPTSAGYAAAASAAVTSTNTTGTIGSDFQTFLEMLTVQMRNQDPLNPIDSTEYAAQLAAFSTVEQAVLTNDLLKSLAAQMGDSSMSQLAGWVGMEARTTAGAHFSGSPITLSPLTAKLADEAWLVVRDANGDEVQRQAIGLDGASFDWAGVDASGNPFDSGVYSFEVENRANGELLGMTPVESYADVVEAQIYDGTTLLVLEGGVRVLTTEVTALRRPA